MRMRMIKTAASSAALLTILVFFPAAGCVDDSPVAYNTYEITTIEPPVDRVMTGGDSVKKVYIGHDLPVNVTITADYDEENVPLQVYLLNVDDVEEYENGIGFASDMRIYYCDRTDSTTVTRLNSGTDTYGIVINVPVEDSRDPLTNDYKTGYFYVLAEVNKNEDAEIDAYTVYRKFKDRLDNENVIFVASDYIKKPDLSVEEMHFTGSEDEPSDVVVWYNVDLTGLPGISNSGLDEEKMIIKVKPSEKDRNFTGTVLVKSSSADALNVPIEFYIKNSDETIKVNLEIYDKTMGGWVETYYIPILKANTTERITVGLRIPDDRGAYNYFSDYEAWPEEPPSSFEEDYPLSYLRHSMGAADYGSHEFTIEAVVNPEGSVQESRFIAPNQDNSEYSEDDYYQDGDAGRVISSSNNSKSEDLVFTLEKVEVSPNDGIKTYPYCKMDPKDPDYRSIVIFWDGFEFAVGDESFGAGAEAHEGMFFYNYSLYSLGVHADAYVFNNRVSLVNTYLNAQSHPYDIKNSGFEMNVQAASKVVLSESAGGFSENNWSYPIVLFTKEFEKVQWYYCFKFTLKAGVEATFTPGLTLNVNEDGSLLVDKTMQLLGSAQADASASIAGLASVGLYTYMDVVTLDFSQKCYTTTELGTGENEGKIKGTLNREVGLYLTGPAGYIDIYFEINFVLFTKRWSKEIYSYSSFSIPLFEMDFLTFASDDYENLTSTNWIDLQDKNLQPLDTSDSE